MSTFPFSPGKPRHAPLAMLAALLALAGCASQPGGYGQAAPQVNDEALLRQQVANKEPEANSRGMYISLIREMQDKGLYFASLAHIDAFEQRYDVVPEVELMRGHALREAGQAKESEAVYRKLLQTPSGAAALQGLGLLAGARGDYAGAIASLREAARRDPTNALIVSDLGYALLRNGDRAAARLPIVQAAELAPENVKILGNLAVFLQVSGDSVRAEAVMKKAGLSAQAQAAVRKMADEMLQERRGQAVAPPAAPRREIQVVRAVAAPVTSAAPEMSRVVDSGAESGAVAVSQPVQIHRPASAPIAEASVMQVPAAQRTPSFAVSPPAAPVRRAPAGVPVRSSAASGNDSLGHAPMQSLLDRFGTSPP